MSTLQLSHQFLRERERLPISSKDSPGQFFEWLSGLSHLGEHNKLFGLRISGRYDIGSLDSYKQALAAFSLTRPRGSQRRLITVGRAHARAAIAGNPSDGYGGITIGFSIKELFADVVARPVVIAGDPNRLQQSLNLLSKLLTGKEIVLSTASNSVVFSSFDQLEMQARDRHIINQDGGLVALVTAACISFFRLFQTKFSLTEPSSSLTSRHPASQGVLLECCTNVPMMVGLAGSSAVITATFRALMSFYHLQPHSAAMDVRLSEWPQIILDVERDLLGISAGLQDRVIQIYEGLVYMDFSTSLLTSQGFGEYQQLPSSVLPSPIFLISLQDDSESSDKVHSNLRERWLSGDAQVIFFMERLRSSSQRLLQIFNDLSGLEISHGRQKQLLLQDFAETVNSSCDCRRPLLGDRVLGQKNIDMLSLARSLGLACNFTGSGGALVCFYDERVSVEERVPMVELKKLVEARGFQFRVCSLLSSSYIR